MSDISKTWCFTLNNWTEKDEQQLKDLEKNYIIIGREVGKMGTPHLQGHVIFKRAYRRTQLEKINPRIHWEKAKVEDAMNYCTKDQEYYIEDNRAQGKRNDLKEICNLPIQTIVKEHPDYFVRYHTGLEKLNLYRQQARTHKPEVTWIWGPTGVGKTRYVVDKEVDLWISGKSLKWWLGYENQTATLFDDFRADFCTFHELLRILDRYPYMVEVKGGQRQLNSVRMYITSCYHPEMVYTTREDIQQLIRRIDKIVNFVTVTEVTDR